MANISPGTIVFDDLTQTRVRVLRTITKKVDGRWTVYYLTDASPCRDASDGWRQAREVHRERKARE